MIAKSKLVFIVVISTILVLSSLTGSSAKEYSKCELQHIVGLVRSLKCKMVGVPVPQCEKDGSYSPVQCSGSTGICCCVNPVTGDNSTNCVRVPGKPVCPPRKLSKCQKQRAIAIYQVEKLHLWGVFTPKCEIDGSYAPVQVPRANLFCCADAQSGKLSSCVFGAPLQACYRNANNVTMYSQCEVHHAAAKALTDCGEMGVYVPRCEKDGSYSPVQCDDGGYCCCADAVTGKRQKSTCVRAPKMPECRQEGAH